MVCTYEKCLNNDMQGGKFNTIHVLYYILKVFFIGHGVYIVPYINICNHYIYNVVYIIPPIY